jgi:hypothetical protein
MKFLEIRGILVNVTHIMQIQPAIPCGVAITIAGDELFFDVSYHDVIEALYILSGSETIVKLPLIQPT